MCETDCKENQVIDMQEAALISVIVPVYNTEQYLFTCIQSIIFQSYSNFEVLLVDDGSTDHSGELCDELQASDSRIWAIHKENGGLSSARNAGVQAARGDYLCFIDSDDYVAPDFLRILYDNLIAYDADVSFCQFVRFTDKTIPDFNASNHVALQEKADLWDILTSTGKGCSSTELVVAWNKLIKRSIAKSLSFPEGRLHEDEFYVHRLLKAADRFVETSAQLYFYRQRSDSIVGIDNKEDIRHLDIVAAFEERIDFYRSLDDSMLYQKIISAYRQTIILQYHNFKSASVHAKLKVRFWRSFIRYPQVERQLVKGYILFAISPKWYYRKYWGE